MDMNMLDVSVAASLKGTPEIGKVAQDFDKFGLDDTKAPAVLSTLTTGTGTLSLPESDFGDYVASSSTSFWPRLTCIAPFPFDHI
jgi:hypothetical protein